MQVKRPFEFSATSCFVRFSQDSDHVTVSYPMIKSLLVIHRHSVSLLFWFSLFLFLTVGHGKQFNSKEAEPSNNLELSSVQVFAYLTRTRGNKGKRSSCFVGYLIYQIIKFRL